MVMIGGGDSRGHGEALDHKCKDKQTVHLHPTARALFLVVTFLVKAEVSVTSSAFFFFWRVSKCVLVLVSFIHFSRDASFPGSVGEHTSLERAPGR